MVGQRLNQYMRGSDYRTEANLYIVCIVLLLVSPSSSHVVLSTRLSARRRDLACSLSIPSIHFTSSLFFTSPYNSTVTTTSTEYPHHTDTNNRLWRPPRQRLSLLLLSRVSVSFAFTMTCSMRQRFLSLVPRRTTSPSSTRSITRAGRTL